VCQNDLPQVLLHCFHILLHHSIYLWMQRVGVHLVDFRRCHNICGRHDSELWLMSLHFPVGPWSSRERWLSECPSLSVALG
jgi:hypothetical protein